MPLDNLISSQRKCAEDIYKSYESGLLPQSLLFSGPRGSGRLTAAMDLSFILTGEERNRSVLRSRSIVFLPHREMGPRLSAAAKMFKEARNDSSRLFLLETLRLINMQYHPALLSSASSSNGDSFAYCQEVEALLSSYEESRDYSDKEINELLKCVDKCNSPKYLYQGKRGPSLLSIDQVRAIQDYFSTKGEEKIAVLEDVEDATEGARNSLLKLLEEPPENSHIILLSSNPQKMLQTILSRVRKFQFPPLGERGTAELIKRRFGLWEDYPSFDSFFFEKGSGEENRRKVEEDIVLTVSSLISSGNMEKEDEERILENLEKLSSWRYFMEKVTLGVKESWAKGMVPPRKAKAIVEIITQTIENVEIYNMSQRMALDLMIRESGDVK